MYKDKDRQREANRLIKAKSRAKGVTNLGMTQGVTSYGNGTCVIPKRGKDIKCFEDLPPDVQQTINKMSIVEGKIDQTIKANRTAIAIHYQHLFPDRYYNTGVA